MKIDSLKELEKLVKLCRKTGVTAITVDGISFQLSVLPSKPAKSADIASHYFPEANIPVPQYKPKTGEIVAEEVKSDDELTEEQLLNWSSAPALDNTEVQ